MFFQTKFRNRDIINWMYIIMSLLYLKYISYFNEKYISNVIFWLDAIQCKNIIGVYNY